MKVIFIHHSCFLIELEDKVIIFDYFGGDKVNGFTFTGKIPDYPEDMPIYMFASHSHHDHYDMDILRWTDRYRNIKYIFSKDIKISPNFLKKHGIDPEVRKRVTFVSPWNEYNVDGIYIYTLKSTDAGVAYYIRVDDVGIFHAGDLGDWSFEGAGDLINGRMRKNYRHEIDKLAEKDIKLAFVPMDPRLAAYETSSIEYFLNHVNCQYVFPMHTWQYYSGIKLLKKRISNKLMADRIMEIDGENQIFQC